MTSAYRETDVLSVLQHLAQLAVGSTGADVERAVRAARGAARRSQRPLTFGDLEAALKDGRPQLTGLLRRRIAVHESGHAVVAMALNIGTVVSITIDGRHGGTTTVRPNPDRDQDEVWLDDQLCFTMAGRAAELEIIGTVGGGSGAGAASDLEHATRVAADMEGRLGFGAVNPFVYLVEDTLRIRLLQDREFAGRVHSRINLAHDRATKIIQNRRKVVECISAQLESSGTLERDRIPTISMTSG